MRRRVKVSMLRKIAGIRALQRAASESEVARANSVLVEKTQLLEHSESEREADEARWQETVCTPLLDLEILSLWTEAVVRRDAAVRHASSDADAAKSIRDRSLYSLHATEQRSDVADELARRGLREHLRELEKDTLQEAADRHLQRRRKE